MSDQPIPGVELSPLALHNLDQLADGDVGLAIKRELEIAVSDLVQYGDDGHVRKVEIVLAMKKRNRSAKAELTVVVGHKLPTLKVRKTQTVFEATAKYPELFFNPQSAANPGQMTLPVGDDDGG